jgi:hypothetical protein
MHSSPAADAYTGSGSSQAVSSCANCDAPLISGQGYCGTCGQRTGRGRLTMRDIGHDVLHAITHADHSIFALVKALALRPGHVARAYVDGRRKRYFGPFAFLVIMVGLASFVIAIAGIEWFRPITDSRAAGFLQRHINLVILMQMPVLAAWCTLFFWSERLHYAEHLVLAAYTTGLRMLFLALVATPVMYFTRQDSAAPVVAILYYGLWLTYFAFAAVQFYRGKTWWIACRAILAGILGQVATTFIILGIIVLFARFN